MKKALSFVLAFVMLLSTFVITANAAETILSANVKLSADSFTYNGKVQTPSVVVKNASGATLTEGTSYDLSFSDGCKLPGSYAVVIIGKGKYTGVVSKTFTIGKQKLKASGVTLSAETYVYDGNVHKPDITVKTEQGVVMTNGASYTLAYSGDFKSVGVHTITVTGMGNFTGTVTKNVTITSSAKEALVESRVKLSSTNVVYNGKERKPSVTITNAAGKTLTEGVSYDVIYPSTCKNAGAYTIKAVGKGNYSGTVSKTFTIAKQPLSADRVTLSFSTYKYDGNVHKPDVTVKTEQGTVMTKDTSYKVSYTGDFKSVGTHTVTITGAGNFTGTVNLTVAIAGTTEALVGSRVKLSSTNVVYNGKERKPSVTITNAAGKTLTEGASYEVVYPSTCKNAGTYTIKVVGKGKYSGTVSKTFTIAKQPLSADRVTLSFSTYKYDGNVHKPNITVKTEQGVVMTKDASYNVTYTGDFKSVGTHTITLTGAGNFTGTVKVNVTITSAKEALVESRVKLSSTNVVYNGKERKPTVTITNAAGKTLTEGSSYEVIYPATCKNAGTYTIKAVGKGNYSGTVSKTFTIAKQALSADRVTLSFSTYKYDGNVHKPDITVKTEQGVVMTKDTSYKVTYAGDFKSAGTHTITITGAGNFTGTVNVTVTITSSTEPLADSRVKLSSTNVVYNGKERKPSVTITNAAGKTLIEGVSYDVIYPSTCKNAGTYTIKAVGKSDYSGTVNKTFIIQGQALVASRVTLSQTDFEYDGKEHKPTVTVKNAAGTVMTEGSSYTVVFSPSVCKNEGTYTVKVTGKGNYSGTVSKTFTISASAEKHQIVYDIANGDTYLAKQTINNPNPDCYYSDKGLTLKNPVVPGYTFLGWYDLPSGSNAEIVKKIPVGADEDYHLYAHWKKEIYQVQFDSPDIPVASVDYTVDRGVPLINPASQFGYTFVGWSNDDGFLVSRIAPGTTGNITLHANWTSNRNKATSYASYGEPIIIEDDVKGQFMFIYDIGKIDNVPLNQIKYIGNSEGIQIDQDVSVSKSVSKETAEKVANTVANATTKSSGWTLADEWSKVYEAGNEIDEQKGKTSVRTDSEGNVSGGRYFVSNSSGGSTFVSNSSGGSNSNSSKVTTSESVGINRSYDNKNESYIDAKLGVKNETELKAGVSVPVKVAKVEAGVKNTTTLSAEVGGGLRNENSFHYDDSYSGHVGTYNENNSSSYYNSTVNNSSTWNSETGYENSYQTSRNHEVSEAISEQLSQKTSYNMKDALSGSKSTNASDTYTDSTSEEYSSSVRYNSAETSATTEHYKYSSSALGYYRLVNAGTVHVFAVVTYDVATSSYYTFTYNVLDDERHIFTDFSLSDPNFGDCENGVVSFEVPYEVNEYVAGFIGRSDGLQFSLNGNVTKYTSTDDNETVVVPQYYSANNTDSTYSAVKVSSISSNAFKGNTKIKNVILPLYVTDIPDGAFEGCTNLENVIAYGVTKIGANAFKGCTKLNKFAIDNLVTSLGANAFENVPEILVNAANANVAENTICCGANRVTLNIGNVGNAFDNKKIVLPESCEYFALYGNGKTWNNLQIETNAGETVINNMTLQGNKAIPLNIKSACVTLNRLTVNDAPGFALVLTSANAELKLYGMNDLKTSSENAVLCKNISLSYANKNVASKLNVDGNILIAGTVTDNEKLLNVSQGGLIIISEEQFESYFTSSKVTFDANGGSIPTSSASSKTVYYGQMYGELPVPTRNYFTFDGWYTEKTGGTKITAESIVNSLVDTTLYAHWTQNTATVYFDANGGTVQPSQKTVKCGNVIEFPTPTRDYYTFDAWYNAPDGGSRLDESEKFTTSGDVTVYAHWVLNPVSDWVISSEMPSDAQVIAKKYFYTERSYTESSNSSMSGWTKYDTKHTGWTNWSDWATWNPDNGVRNVEWRSVYDHTQYHYYRWYNGYATYNYQKDSSYWLEETWFDYVLPSYKGYTYMGYYEVNDTHHAWAESQTPENANSKYVDSNFTKDVYRDEWRYRDPVYTYYYYKDTDKEGTTLPGGNNILNVREYVQYRPRTIEYAEIGTVTYKTGTYDYGYNYSLVSCSQPISWELAELYCKQHGVDLLTVSSDAEQAKVAELGGVAVNWNEYKNTHTLTSEFVSKKRNAGLVITPVYAVDIKKMIATGYVHLIGGTEFDTTLGCD